MPTSAALQAGGVLLSAPGDDENKGPKELTVARPMMKTRGEKRIPGLSDRLQAVNARPARRKPLKPLNLLVVLFILKKENHHTTLPPSIHSDAAGLAGEPRVFFTCKSWQAG